MSMEFDRTSSDNFVLLSVLINFIWENPHSHAVFVAGKVSIKSMKCRMLLYSVEKLVFTCFQVRVEKFDENLKCVRKHTK